MAPSEEGRQLIASRSERAKSILGKCCVIGDPKILENDQTYIRVEDAIVQLMLFDSDGQHELAVVRKSSYCKTDVFLVCYSIEDRASFEHVRTHWIREVREQVTNGQGFLVALKTDLYASIGERGDLVTPQEGEALAGEIGATNFYECSSLDSSGVYAIFNAASRVVLQKHLASKRACVVS